MTTRFRPPLTTDELTAIRKRHPSSMDTLALLWEIKRPRSVLLRMDQLARSQMPWGGVLDGLWKQLKTDLTDEPCVRDQARLTQSLLNPERKGE